MEEKICPLCGKDVKAKETYCDDCLQMAKDEFPDYIKDKKTDGEIASQEASTDINNVEVYNSIETGTDEENNPAKDTENVISDLPPAKSSKNTLIFLAIGLILLVVIGAVGSYKMRQERIADEKAEIAFWDRCAEEGTPLSYSKYLVKFPDGKFAQSAESNITKLRDQERQAWIDLQKSGDINAFSNYLKSHPDSPYKDFAYTKIDSLGWMSAKKENTLDSYNNYLDSVKNGVYAGNYAPSAQKEWDYLTLLKEVGGDDLKGIKKNMLELAKFLSASQYNNAQKLVNPIITNYFGEKQKEAKDIITFMKNDKKAKKMKSITYTFRTDSIQVIQDNVGLHFFDMSVEQKVIYIDRKKKEERTSFLLKIELDKNKLLRSVELK